MDEIFRIKPGDYVTVDFNNAQTTLCPRAKVVYVPTCVGDNWIFVEEHTNKVFYVSEPCTVSK